MSLHLARRFWLRNKRRLADARGVLERRKFKALRHEFYTDLWREAAETIGADLQVRPNGLTQISKSGLATFVSQSDLMLDSELTLRMMANKALTFELMRTKSVRLPDYDTFDLASLDKAEAFMQAQGGKPVVVKPSDGTGGGRGVTTNIRTTSALHTACRNAAGFNPRLMVEEQLTGSSFRLLYLDGDFIDAVRRDSPAVTGDGKSTIRQLVAMENAARRDTRPVSALSPLVIDQESRNTLIAQGLSPTSVPAAGETVNVKIAVNENASRQNHIVRADIHPEIIETGQRLVKAFGIRFAGLDVTADDISVPLGESGALFNEINVNPGIHHHYLVAEQDARADVAPLMLERMFTTRQGVIEL